MHQYRLCQLQDFCNGKIAEQEGEQETAKVNAIVPLSHHTTQRKKRRGLVA